MKIVKDIKPRFKKNRDALLTYLKKKVFLLIISVVMWGLKILTLSVTFFFSVVFYVFHTKGLVYVGYSKLMVNGFIAIIALLGKPLQKIISFFDQTAVNLIHPHFRYCFVGKFKILPKTNNKMVIMYFLMLLSKLAYMNDNKVARVLGKVLGPYVKSYDFRLCTVGDNKRYDTDFLILKVCGVYYVVFRGTEPFNIVDWRTDFDFRSYKPFKRKLVEGGEEIKTARFTIHEGIFRALFTVMDEVQKEERTVGTKKVSVVDKIVEILEDLGYFNEKVAPKIFVTGHSLGGGLANVFSAVAYLLKKKEVELIDVLKTKKFSLKGLERLNISNCTSFAAPRFYNGAVLKRFQNGEFNGLEAMNVVCDFDPVPAMPMWFDSWGIDVILSCFRGNDELWLNVIKKIRGVLPLFMFCPIDHLPGLYFKCISHRFGLPFKKHEWERVVRNVVSKKKAIIKDNILWSNKRKVRKRSQTMLPSRQELVVV